MIRSLTMLRTQIKNIELTPEIILSRKFDKYNYLIYFLNKSTEQFKSNYNISFDYIITQEDIDVMNWFCDSCLIYLIRKDCINNFLTVPESLEKHIFINGEKTDLFNNIIYEFQKLNINIIHNMVSNSINIRFSF